MKKKLFLSLLLLANMPAQKMEASGRRTGIHIDPQDLPGNRPAQQESKIQVNKLLFTDQGAPYIFPKEIMCKIFFRGTFIEAYASTVDKLNLFKGFRTAVNIDLSEEEAARDLTVTIEDHLIDGIGFKDITAYLKMVKEGNITIQKIIKGLSNKKLETQSKLARVFRDRCSIYEECKLEQEKRLLAAKNELTANSSVISAQDLLENFMQTLYPAPEHVQTFMQVYLKSMLQMHKNESLGDRDIDQLLAKSKNPRVCMVKGWSLSLLETYTQFKGFCLPDQMVILFPENSFTEDSPLTPYQEYVLAHETAHLCRHLLKLTHNQIEKEEAMAEELTIRTLHLLKKNDAVYARINEIFPLILSPNASFLPYVQGVLNGISKVREEDPSAYKMTPIKGCKLSIQKLIIPSGFFGIAIVCLKKLGEFLLSRELASDYKTFKYAAIFNSAARLNTGRSTCTIINNWVYEENPEVASQRLEAASDSPITSSSMIGALSIGGLYLWDRWQG